MNIIPLGSGKCSFFGGPMDSGVGNLEGLSCIDNSDLNNWWFRRLFLPAITLSGVGEWDKDKGLARNLNPNTFYCAMRWNYGTFNGVAGEILVGYSREQVRNGLFVIEVNGKRCIAQAADWGPNTDTGRLIDLSPGAVKALGVSTDDIVGVSAII